MPKDITLTAVGLKKLEDELEHLETVRRIEVSERIKEAKSFGDLSENAEYDDAKNEQGMIESRIIEINSILERAVAIEVPKSPKVVQIGTTVELKSMPDGRLVVVDIVGSAEVAIIKNGNGHLCISDESPVGAALMGHKAADVVSAQTPAGSKQYEIVSISPLKFVE